MKTQFNSFIHSLSMALFAAWIFAVWRIAGMPAPGFAGRFIPLAWLLASVLNGRNQRPSWFIPMVLSFTAGSWLWMLYPDLWMIAAAIPVTGLIAWGITTARKGFGVVRAVLPLLFLSLITAEINGDEVRFAEQAAALSGISSESFSETHLRSGDISTTEGHHTPLFPLLISPGLLAGDFGLRIIPVIIALLALLLLSKLTNPGIAVTAALLYPGFGIFGLAMTGWLALGLFTLAALMPEGKKFSVLRFLIAFVLVALKMRYIGLSAGIFIAEYACMTMGRRKWLTPLVWIGSALAVLVIDRFFLGGMIFWSRYGNIGAVNLIQMNLFNRPLDTLANAGWSLFDPEAGLIFRAPWVIAAIAGLVFLKRNQPSRFKRLFIPSLLYWLLLVLWSGSSWHGLPAPIGRMFLPILPLFAAGLAYVWKEKETKLLVILSIAFSAIVVASPVCRYNYADGTDSILTLIGITSGFSMVRSNSIQLLAALFFAFSLLAVFRKPEDYRVFSFLIIFAVVFALGIHPAGYEAEDLPPEIVQGAALYPHISDPLERYFWFNSREIMLELGESGQTIRIPGAEAGDMINLQMSGGGGFLSVGSRLLPVETPLIELPPAFNTIRRDRKILPDWPENRLVQSFSILLDSIDTVAGTVLIQHHSGPPVYIDRIDISKGTQQP